MSYEPKTELGRKLVALRQKFIDSGGKFMTESELDSYIHGCDHDAEIEALTSMAREAIPDYPFDPKHPLPLREAIYGLTEGYRGVSLACDDLQKSLAERDAEISRLREENARMREALKELEGDDLYDRMGSQTVDRGDLVRLVQSIASAAISEKPDER